MSSVRAAPQVLPYGSWPTPITSAVLVESAVGLSDVRVDGAEIIWSESRPSEGGRIQLVACDASFTTRELLGDGHSARTAVHEYGGGAWWARDGIVWFADWSDQRLYRLDAGTVRDPGGAAVALTPVPAVARGDRYADGDLHPDGDWIACVRERHARGGRAADVVVNEIVRLRAHEPSEPEVLVSGPDFVASPRFDAGGERLCWVEWDHPHMPWEASRLVVRDLRSGEHVLVAGGPDESVSEPRWQPDGSLTFISDRTGWCGLYRWSPDGGATVALVELEADIGLPQWTLGSSRYAVLGDGRVVFAGFRDGADRLGVRLRDGTLADLAPAFSCVFCVCAVGQSAVALVAGRPAAEPSVSLVRLGEGAAVRWGTALRPARDLRGLGIDAADISLPESIAFPTGGGGTAHGLFYAPLNPRYAGPDGELPPLIVMIHGGPTSAAIGTLRLAIQYWTSRGFAVVDVNYRGSVGYGRAYRELLDGAWGVADVEDCIAAATWLAGEGRVEGARLCIRGGSAGGFTTLAALARADTPFAAGADSFGVADIEALAADTHKFESRYTDSLVGPYPEAVQIYRERSPIHHVDAFTRPLIVLQGLEDEVVPPNQSMMIVQALRDKGVPVAYVAFEGEQHGFRRAENIRRAIDSELSFYAQIFGFALPEGEGIEPVEIENLAGCADA